VIVTDATRHARLGQLLDKALGFPRDADARGARCPPAPFGRTERYTAPADLDGDGFPTLEIVTSVSNAVGSSDRLTGLERAEYAQLIAGAQPSGTLTERAK
jgi:hypothetical protein